MGAGKGADISQRGVAVFVIFGVVSEVVVVADVGDPAGIGLVPGDGLAEAVFEGDLRSPI